MMLDCFGFALPRCVLGPENLCHNLNQRNAKTKTRLGNSRLPRFKEVACCYFEFSLANNHGKVLF